MRVRMRKKREECSNGVEERERESEAEHLLSFWFFFRSLILPVDILSVDEPYVCPTSTLPTAYIPWKQTCIPGTHVVPSMYLTKSFMCPSGRMRHKRKNMRMLDTITPIIEMSPLKNTSQEVRTA